MDDRADSIRFAHETRKHVADVLAHIDTSVPPLSTGRAEQLKRQWDAMALRSAADVIRRRSRRPGALVVRVMVRCLERAARRLEAGP